MTHTGLETAEVASEHASLAQAPKVEYDRPVPYDEYVRASTLHTLQRPLSNDPGEMSFLVITQVMELYFGLIHYELRQGQRRLADDDLWGALAPLRRASLHLDGLNAAWQGLSWMTPTDFNRFRGVLGEASGFQSAMYRHLELALGFRNPSLIKPFRRQPELYQKLMAELHRRSVYDEVIAALARHGHDLPADLLERDFSQEHQPHPAVERAWVEVYRDDSAGNHLRLVGEALTDIADRFHVWRERHLMAVRRSMGAKTGTAGSSGISWLERSLARTVFPELWTARTEM
ncbi:MAG TPA: tryptophan 2,3-dioxygenase family protein [Natronosporangium sp.]|nr:tryptophan 2,3-dioxygenase family protein [Natronosporangium sp.]